MTPGPSPALVPSPTLFNATDGIIYDDSGSGVVQALASAGPTCSQYPNFLVEGDCVSPFEIMAFCWGIVAACVVVGAGIGLGVKLALRAYQKRHPDFKPDINLQSRMLGLWKMVRKPRASSANLARRKRMENFREEVELQQRGGDAGPQMPVPALSHEEGLGVYIVDRAPDGWFRG